MNRRARLRAIWTRRAMSTRAPPSGDTWQACFSPAAWARCSVDDTVAVLLTVNGTAVSRRIEPRQSLVDFLRYELELTGSHVGCEHGVCGACSVRVSGRARLPHARRAMRREPCGYH